MANSKPSVRDQAESLELSLAKAFREDSELIRMLCAAKIEKVEWGDNVCAQIARYPLLLIEEKPREVKTRNVDFTKAIARFLKAVDTFERRAGCRLRTLNDAVRPWGQSDSTAANRNSGHAFDVRNVEKKTIQDYLRSTHEAVNEGDYGSSTYDDPIVSTPSGGRPTSDASMAQWLCIGALECACIPKTPSFNIAAAYCATQLLILTTDFRKDLAGEAWSSEDEDKTIGQETISDLLRTRPSGT